MLAMPTPATTAAPTTAAPQYPHRRVMRFLSSAPLDVARVPEVQHHRGPQPRAVIALASLMGVEQPREGVAAQQAQPGEAGLEQHRPRPLAQAPGEQLERRRAEALLGPVDDVVRQHALDRLLEEELDPALARLERRGDVVDLSLIHISEPTRL